MDPSCITGMQEYADGLIRYIETLEAEKVSLVNELAIAQARINELEESLKQLKAEQKELETFYIHPRDALQVLRGVTK